MLSLKANVSVPGHCRIAVEDIEKDEVLPGIFKKLTVLMMTTLSTSDRQAIRRICCYYYKCYILSIMFSVFQADITILDNFYILTQHSKRF